MQRTGRWWVLLPVELETFAQVEALAPALARLMAVRVRACHPDSVLPERWWAFPNPRNVRLACSRLPRLLIPRTADRLRASFDPQGHMIKGTNTMILARPGGVYSIHALMGLLNSTTMQALVAGMCPDYHGIRVRLEPAVLRKIPVPNPFVGHRMQDIERLELAVREALQGSGSWEVVDRAAKTIYE